MNSITQDVIAAAIAVHRELRPGLLEATYRKCLGLELVLRDHEVDLEHPLPVTYRGVTIECGYRIDLLVDKSVVVEVKSIEKFDRVHAKQVQSYLRLSDRRVGLLINFNVKWLVNDGLKRIVNNFPE